GRVTSSQRSYTRNDIQFVKPPPGSQYDGIYDRVPFGNLGWFGSGTGGAVDADGDFLPDFDGNTGGAWDFGTFPGGISSFTFQQGGSATPTSQYFGDLLANVKRYDANLFGHYDLTPGVRVFTEMKYVKTKSFAIGQPTFDAQIALTPD